MTQVAAMTLCIEVGVPTRCSFPLIYAHKEVPIANAVGVILDFVGNPRGTIPQIPILTPARLAVILPRIFVLVRYRIHISLPTVATVEQADTLNTILKIISDTDIVTQR